MAVTAVSAARTAADRVGEIIERSGAFGMIEPCCKAAGWVGGDDGVSKSEKGFCNLVDCGGGLVSKKSGLRGACKMGCHRERVIESVTPKSGSKVKVFI